jgi:hypothetical protein
MCLEEVAANVDARRSAFASNAAGAKSECEVAVDDCFDFCTGAPPI